MSAMEGGFIGALMAEREPLRVQVLSGKSNAFYRHSPKSVRGRRGDLRGLLILEGTKMLEAASHLIRMVTLTLSMALLASCAFEPSQSVRQERAQRATQSINLQGFPPEYRQGFTDGCATVGGASSPKPAGEPNYVQGWQDGFKHCTNRRPH